MLKKFVLVCLLSTLVVFTPAQVIYNAYAKVTNISGSTMTVTNLTEPTSYSFATTEQVIIMQMKDTVIGANTNVGSATFGNVASIERAGLWEVKTLSSIVRSGSTATVTFSGALANSYNFGASGALQIISLRRLSAAAFTTTSNITGTAWNGSIGGVVAIEVGTNLTLQHSISANGLGFRGGLPSVDFSGPTCSAPSLTVYSANDNQLGAKGEGIHLTSVLTFSNARGRMSNGGGGGNHHNAGGGGGGNWTAGGTGGTGFSNCTTFPGGGLGGQSLSAFVINNRIFMGGGGGGGQKNENLGSAGGRGGGIVIIKADQITTGTTCSSPIRITANGVTVPNGGYDGQGGGGAAGTIVLQVNTFSTSATCPLFINANGGHGGTSSTGLPHGGGGGGAQGLVVFSSPQPTTNVTVTTNNGNPGCDNNSNPCAYPAGSPTGTNNSGILTNIGGALPISLVNFKAEKRNGFVLLHWETNSELNNDFFTVEKSSDAVNFTPLENVKSKAMNGTSQSMLKYSLWDTSPRKGITYYILKQTDRNGNFKYFNSVQVKEDDDYVFNVSVYPNPNTGEFTLDLDGVKNSVPLDVLLYDVTGKLVYSRQLSEGFTDRSLEIVKKDIASGVYICNVISGGVKHALKIVVQ
jgi:hypothetical protein